MGLVAFLSGDGAVQPLPKFLLGSDTTGRINTHPKEAFINLLSDYFHITKPSRNRLTIEIFQAEHFTGNVDSPPQVQDF